MTLNLITLKIPPQISSDPEHGNGTGLSNVSGHGLKASIKYHSKATQSALLKNRNQKTWYVLLQH